jgi:hypothetical protein
LAKIECAIARRTAGRDNQTLPFDAASGPLSMTVPFPPLLLVALIVTASLPPRAASAQSFLFGREEEAPPPPTVEIAREGPFEVTCVDRRDNEIISYGPLFRVLRNNGTEVRWQYEMQDGLTFIGRFDDWLTCQWKDRRR